MKRSFAVLLLAAAPAHAGRTSYGWLPAVDTLPDGTFELQTSLYEHDNLGPYHERSTSLVWTPSIAVTRCLELAFPVELVTRTEDDAAPWSGIGRYGAELRWRFLRNWPELRPLARFALSRDVQVQSEVHSELEAAAAYDVDRLELELDLGGMLDVNFGHFHSELRAGVGASARITGELRLGAELYAMHSRDATATSWAAIGPDVAWQRGRFWLAGALGIGIEHISAAPRLNLGMAWR